ncbi:hypothetical protein REPUB_Repub03eG0097300 [Reevesia pubescens]
MARVCHSRSSRSCDILNLDPVLFEYESLGFSNLKDANVNLDKGKGIKVVADFSSITEQVPSLASGSSSVIACELGLILESTNGTVSVNSPGSPSKPKQVYVQETSHASPNGCFGCCAKPTPIIAVDEPSKRLRIRGRIVMKPSISDDFWSNSKYDLEHIAVQSQRSLPSISVSNPTLSQCSIANPSDFVNQGLIVWNQTRLQWIGSSRPKNHTQQSREPKLSWNATYESLLGTSNPFPRPIPLSEMIDFLVEVWEQEGLYDCS